MVLDEAFKLSARDEVLQRPDIRKTGINPNFWYPVARSDNVKTGKPHGVSFAGEPIVDTTSLAPHNGNAAMNKKQRVLHIVGKNLTRIARPKPKVTRDMKNVSAVLHRCVNRIPSEEIALHPVDQTIAAHFFRSRQRPNISARLNQQRRHMTPDKTGCASDEDMLSDEKMMKIVRDHADRMIAGTSCFRAWMTSAGKSISIHGSPVTSSYPNRPASTNVLKTSS